ncbi:hypothetical protein [Croceivirga radicis]|uniref:hypothetical protein n=1 Tax=Croceivirga radicis TaxID=1929488 RepID=UPI000255ACEF|nr:hypothetical protein [Croceivirga radicis]
MHLHFTENATQLILLAMIIIVFFQSGLDKVFDWQGNLSWLKSHFEETPFSGLVPVLLGTILVMELIAGILSVMGFAHLLLFNDVVFAFYGALLADVTLLMLLLGQRVAKDYEGAKTIVIYIVPVCFLLFLVTK